MAQLDASLRRRFLLGERTAATFGVEAANITNTPFYADPVRILSSPLFGYSTNQLSGMLGAGRPNLGLTPAFQPGAPRTIELNLRLIF